jgi:hypothetical protein
MSAKVVFIHILACKASNTKEVKARTLAGG